MSESYEGLVHTPAERLLVWMSETGTGPWSGFRRVAGYLEEQVDWKERLGPSGLIRSLSASGHAEMDWNTHRWSVAPPVLATVPGLPHGALVVGARTGAFYGRLAQLERGDTDLDVYMTIGPPPGGRPASVRPTYTLGRSIRDTEATAKFLGIPVVYHPAEALARVLSKLADHIRSAPRRVPPPESEVKTFDPRSVGWTDARSHTSGPTLRAYDPARGPKRFLIHTQSGIYDAGKEHGIYAALASVGRNVLGWKSTDVHGELYVPVAAPLPELHARAALLCSGLEPDEVPREFGSTHRYINVPRWTAEAIATTLEQRLTVPSTMSYG